MTTSSHGPLSPADISRVINTQNLMDCISETFARLFPDSRPPDGGILLIAIHDVSDRGSSAEGTTFSILSQIGNIGDKNTESLFRTAAQNEFDRLRQRRSEGHPDVASSETADMTNSKAELRTHGGCVAFPGEAGRTTYLAFIGQTNVGEHCMLALGEMLGLGVDPGFEPGTPGGDILRCAREVFGESLKLNAVA